MDPVGHLVVNGPQRFVSPAQVKLDASGNGQVTVSPGSVDWVTTLITVSTSTATKHPQANLYLDQVAPTCLLEGTYTGDNDSTNTSHLVQSSQQLICAWTGGDPGATATVRVTGLAYPPGQGVQAFGGR